MLAQKKKGVRPFSRFSRGGPPEPPTPFDSALRRRRPDLHLQDFPLIDSHPTGLAQGVGAGPSYREAKGGSVSVAGRWGRFPAFRVLHKPILRTLHQSTLDWDGWTTQARFWLEWVFLHPPPPRRQPGSPAGPVLARWRGSSIPSVAESATPATRRISPCTAAQSTLSPSPSSTSCTPVFPAPASTDSPPAAGLPRANLPDVPPARPRAPAPRPASASSPTG